MPPAVIRDAAATGYVRMARLAEQYGAANLATGVPGDVPPAVLVRAAARAMADGQNQYSPPEGLASLRQAVADGAARSQGVGYDPSTEVTVTAGCTEGMASAALALLGAYDEVVGLEPFYDYYPEWIRMAGARFVPVPMVPSPQRFGVDVDAVAAAVTPRTRALLLNTPHNPTGACFTNEELEGLAALASYKDLLVFVDEVYEHLTYVRAHRSIAALPGMRERTVVASSVSKCFSASGWRIGWVLAPTHLSARIRFTHRHIGCCAPTPLQVATEEALRWAASSNFYEDLRLRHANRRDHLAAAIAGTGLRPLLPEGGVFLFTPCPWPSPEAFCQVLAEEVGVVPLPMDSFYATSGAGPGYIRFAFCQSDAVIDDAARRLCARSVPMRPPALSP